MSEETVLRQWNALTLRQAVPLSDDAAQRRRAAETAPTEPRSKALKRVTRPFGKAPSGRYRARRAADFVVGAGAPQSAAEISAALEVSGRDAQTMAETAVRAGLLRKSTRDGVFVYLPPN